MIWCLIFFACVFLFKILSNTVYYFRTRELRNMFNAWINGTFKGDYLTYRSEVIALFKRAKIKDQWYKIGRPVDYNTAVTNHVSLFQNFPDKEPTLAAAADFMFAEAVGYFRKGIFDSLNPLYWIDLIVFCPKYVLEYIGADMDKSTSKALYVVLNFLWWLAGIFFAFLQSEAKGLILKLLG